MEKMLITVHRIVDVTLMESVSSRGEKLKVHALIVDVTQMAYVNLIEEKPMDIVRIVQAQTAVGEKHQAMAQILAQGVHWVQMDVSILHPHVIHLTVHTGMEPNVYVNTPNKTLVEHVEKRLNAIVYLPEVLIGKNGRVVVYAQASI